MGRGLLSFRGATDLAVEHFMFPKMRMKEEIRQKMRQWQKEHQRIPNMYAIVEESLWQLYRLFGSNYEASLYNMAPELDFSSTVSLYDLDWDGMGAQAVLNKFRPLPSHWITYHIREKALDFVKKERPKKILLLDYEPHNLELEIFSDIAEKILIFGKHIRSDLIELASSDQEKIRYINGMNFDSGERPITYLMWHVVSKLSQEKLDKAAAVPASLGTYGYGWAPLAKDISEKTRVPYDHKLLRRITGKLMRLVSFNHDYADEVLKALTESNTFNGPSIKHLIAEYRTRNLDQIYEDTRNDAIRNCRVIGDTIIFPVKGWQTTKPFTYDLRKIARNIPYQRDLTIIIDCQDAYYRKLSFRTAEFDDPRFNIADLLEKTYQSLPPHIERNHGAHQSSGGAVCKYVDSALVLRQILYTHFTEARQEHALQELAALEDHDLMFQ